MSYNVIQRNNSILLVEDNPDDVLMTKRALLKGRVQNTLHVVSDGEKAIKFLRKQDEYQKAPTPMFILLDLKMPKLDGFQVLKEIKGDDKLKSIPIIVLTTSDRDKDVDDAYRLGCNSYIVKPVSFENFINTVVKIKDYWLTISQIPSELR
jgi:chemotaxis family two-component system response regulator Rcp1